MEKLNRNHLRKFEARDRSFKVLFVNFSYVIDVYQRKLDVASRTGIVEIGVLVPRKWKMREWNKTITLNKIYPNIRYFPANIWFLNGIQGGFLYPILTILKTILIFKPNILQVEQEVFSLSTFELALFARFFKIPLVIFCFENMDKKFSVIRNYTRKFVFDTARVINPGNKEAAELMRKWGYKGNIEIMPIFGVDLELFHPQIRTNNDQPFSIGYVGRLVNEKGIDLIFHAAQILITKGYELSIIICGTGPEERNLSHLAKQLELSKKIIWIGATPYQEVPKVISKLDVLVLPSRAWTGKWKEQFGHVLIEAMAMGIPVVGSSSGAIPDVIARSDLIFQENDAHDLASILEKMITDKDWWTELSHYGLDRVSKEFSHEIIEKKMIKIWETIIKYL